MQKNKKVVLSLWLILLVSFMGYYFCYPESFTKENLSLFFNEFGSYVIVVYLLFSLLRGFFLVPSTVLILAGTLFLSPVEVFIYSMIGIIGSSTLVFYFSEYLGINELVEKQFGEKKVKKMEEKIRNNGIKIVAAWSFFPAVPTDVICYVAGSIKMNYWRFLVGLVLGEIPLVLLYVFTGYGLLELFN